MLLYILSLATVAYGLGSEADFQAAITESYRQCLPVNARGNIERRRNHFDQSVTSPRVVAGTCPGLITIKQYYNVIPGGRTMVQRNAPAYFMRTLELCASREEGGSDDWRTINANRGKLGSGLQDDAWRECQTQMEQEKADCKTAKQVLCAFKQG